MSRTVAFVLVVSVFFVSAWPSLAQDEPFAATITSGDCESETVVAELTELVLPTGAEIGAADGRTAASSFTTVPVSFEQLTSTDHAIRAGDSCGPIGGSLNAEGALIVALSGPAGDSGIAYLSPSSADAGQADVSLFVVPPGSAQGTTESGPEEARTEIQSNIDENTDEITVDPTQEPEPTPTPEPDPLGLSEGNPAPIGTSLDNEGLVVTVLNAYYSGVFGLSTPKGGYTYLVLDVQLQNNGDRGRTYGSSNFSGQDADTGVGYDSVFVVADGTLGNGDLDPGEFVSGAIILEVQQTATRIRIKYDPAAFDPNDLYWILQ